MFTKRFEAIHVTNNMTSIEPIIESIRARFPALARKVNGSAAIYLDGPAGTQVPESVVERIAECMLNHNANRSGRFATSREEIGRAHV